MKGIGRIQNLGRATIAGVLLVSSLLVSQAFAGDTKSSAPKKPTTKAKAAKSTKPGGTAAQKKKQGDGYVNVTGSNLRYRVNKGSTKPNVPLNVDVIDTKDAKRQGYSSVADMLSRNPAIYRGSPGRF